jgi:chemotaxis signal transduction protein
VLVLVETPDMALCLLVDEVLAVSSLLLSGLREADAGTLGLPHEYVRDVTRWRERPLVILDLPALLADPDLIINQEII